MKSLTYVACILAGLIFMPALVSGQTGKITGKITGAENEMLTGAVAELRNSKDSVLARVAVADAGGEYVLDNVKPGEYYIKTSFLGYLPHTTKPFNYDGTSAKLMPEIKMEATAVTLKSAEVTAIKPLVEVKSDKTVFNVENSINATGSTAYELLQKAPGVTVDNNDNITLKGRGGVMVQIDGRPARLSDSELADYLKSVQSTDVESIELISNPSSKYDAEGTAGIVNIKIKKNNIR